MLRVSIGFLILFFTLRTVAIEPFGVPTGSMAPTLIGNHREGPCPRCGHAVRTGDPGAGERNDSYSDSHCPNCGKRGVDLTQVRNISGDRLMVDKNVFNLRKPRRWEVAVFRCPIDDSKPYVKRIAGLPGEEITIVEGDVYANGEIVRKEFAEVREVRLPFFDMNFAPQPRGWNERWLVEPAADPRLPALFPIASEQVPVTNTILHDNALDLNAADHPERSVSLWYRHTEVRDGENGKADEGVKEISVTAWNSYNGPPRRSSRPPAVHDFAVSCDLEIMGGEGVCSLRLYDGADSVTLDLPIGPKPKGVANLTRDKHGALAEMPDAGLETGKTYHLEFAFFDRRAFVAIDGKELFPPCDIPAAPKREDVKRPLQIGARGCRVLVRNLKLFEDITYTHGAQPDAQPWRLGRDEYFMLGDNSANSHDSREWLSREPNPRTGKYDPKPGVPERDFIGKPFLIHQPLRLGRTTVGGRERQFQTLDWSRLRWVH